MVQLTGCIRLVRLCVPLTVAFMLCNAASQDTSGKYQIVRIRTSTASGGQFHEQRFDRGLPWPFAIKRLPFVLDWQESCGERQSDLRTGAAYSGQLLPACGAGPESIPWWRCGTSKVHTNYDWITSGSSLRAAAAAQEPWIYGRH